jgi:drug/metabolite transporter (DMT)-like permease
MAAAQAPAQAGARPRKHRAAALAALAAGIVCIGFSAIFVKLAGLPGPVSALYRVLVAGAVLLPWWLARRDPLPAREDIRLILTGGLFFAIDIALWNTSILYTSAATATLLANNSPLWVGLASFLLFRERLSGSYWLGLAVAMAGTVWLVGGDAYRHLRLDPGNLLALLAGVFYAAYLLVTHRARKRVDLLPVMTLSTLASIAVLLLLNLALGTTLTGFSRRAWLALAGMGLVSQLGGWLAISYALGHLRAAPVSVALLAQVVVTALAAMPLLGEYLKVNQIGGGVLVLGGIYLVTRGRGEQ